MRIFILETFFCLMNIRINQYQNSNQQPAIPHSGQFYSQIWQYLLGMYSRANIN